LRAYYFEKGSRDASMALHDQRSATPARSAHVSRRLARLARAQLAAGGLSHRQQRLFRAVLRERMIAVRQRRRRLRRVTIAVVGAIAAMAITGLSFGLVPAIEAARGEGITGSFVVSQEVCSSRGGCQWVGTFQAGDRAPVAGLAYGGSLPAGDGPGSSILVRYPGSSDQVYAVHASHTWVFDLLITLAIGMAVGAALWISPLGAGPRNPEGVRGSGVRQGILGKGG
jgi:hypothetical protein